MIQQSFCQHPPCDRLATSAGWCNAHYIRLRQGKHMDAPVKCRNKGKVCCQDGCERPAQSKGMCDMHARRLRSGSDMTAPPRGQMRECKQGGCDRQAVCKGYCQPHYSRFRKGHDMTTPIRPKTASYRGAICQQDECARLAKANGWCSLHWHRARNGVPMDAPLRVTVRNDGKCQWNGCERRQEKRNLCDVHYERQRQGRDMDAPLGEPVSYNTGATRAIAKGGYVEVKVSGHFGKHRPRGAGWHWEHHYVMEQHLGRTLREGENVHHKNGDRTDNRIDNLELWTSSQPAGQRVIDLLNWADGIIAQYEPELDKLRTR